MLKRTLDKDNIFYIAYTIDIVAQEMHDNPQKAFHKIKRAQKVIGPVLGEDSIIGQIFELFSGMNMIIKQRNMNEGLRVIQQVEDNFLRIYHGDKTVPYLEAVYMGKYLYYVLKAQTEVV